MKEYFTGIHNKDCKVVQYSCMMCGEENFTVADVKGTGVSKCSLCGNRHQVSTFKNGRWSIKNKGLQ